METPDASSVRGNQKEQKRRVQRGREGRKAGREVEQPDTSLVRLPNQVGARV